MSRTGDLFLAQSAVKNTIAIGHALWIIVIIGYSYDACDNR
jgi:hypothetical protein